MRAVLMIVALATPFPAPNGNCPSGYYLSGGFCNPTNSDNRPAMARPQGASCPTGWYASGNGCVQTNKPKGN